MINNNQQHHFINIINNNLMNKQEVKSTSILPTLNSDRLTFQIAKNLIKNGYDTPIANHKISNHQFMSINNTSSSTKQNQNNPMKIRRYSLKEKINLQKAKQFFTKKKIEANQRKLTSSKQSILSYESIVDQNENEKHKKLVYENSHQQFFKYYKNLQRTRQNQKEKGKQESPFHTILRYITLYNLSPNTLELIKEYGSQYKLNLDYLGLGKSKTIKMILDVIQDLEMFKIVNLSKNNIDMNSSPEIIKKLNSVENINLSFNSIGLEGIKSLSHLFNFSSKCRIQYLNLQSNSLSDSALMILVQALNNYKQIKILNISQNFGSIKTARSLQKLIESTDQLNQLYLHWNQFNSNSAQLVFQSLIANKSLKVLDFSWNRIGNNITIFKKICSVLQHNLYLLHLDLSFCNFSLEQSKILSQSLQFNQSLVGLHYEGNYGSINAQGYLILAKDEIYKEKILTYPMPIKSKIAVRRINSIQYQPTLLKKIQSDQWKQSKNVIDKIDICWICLGWQQKKFIIQNSVDSNQDYYIHFEFQKYASCKMNKVNNIFQINRIIPPSQISFFFSVGKDFQNLKISKSYASQTKIIKIDTIMKENKQFSNIELQIINKSTISRQIDIIDEFYEYQFRDPIRKRENIIQPQNNNAFPLNFFKPINFNNDFVQKCLDYDLKNSKIIKVVRKQQDLLQIINFIKPYYMTLRSIFTYFAARQITTSNRYGISNNKSLDFGQKFGIISKRINSEIYLIKFLASLPNVTSEEQNNELMTRSTFIQFLIRLAQQKYVKGKYKNKEGIEIKYTYLMAIKKLIQKMVKCQTQISNYIDWKKIRYWNEDNQKLLKLYKPFLEKLYKKYAGIFQKNKKVEKKLISLQELRKLMRDSKILINSQIEKDLNTCYDYSKTPIVEQINNIKRIGLIEFMEFLGRFADKRNFYPIGYNEDFFNQSQKALIPLCFKLEGLLYKLVKQNSSLSNTRLERYMRNSIFSQQIKDFLFITIQLEDEIKEIKNLEPFLNNGIKIKLNTMDQINLQTTQDIRKLKAWVRSKMQIFG